MLKILVIGDIMGKIGRRALTKELTKLRKKYSADFIIANGENMAHGLGVTTKTLREVLNAGVDFFTSGNHIWNKQEEFKKALKEQDLVEKIIRPANYKKVYRKPGEGYKVIKIKDKRILVINILGSLFMKAESEKVKPPVLTALEIIKEHKNKKIDAIFVDIHAEATSEKRAMGWALDGVATAVWGTHTHIPTADAQILPEGTGYVTDLGMVGAKNSVLGIDKDAVIKEVLKKSKKLAREFPETGRAVIQGIYLEIENKKTKKIKQVLHEVTV